MTNQQGRSGIGAAHMVVAGLCFALVNTVTQHVTMRLGAASSAVAFWQYLVATMFFLPWVWQRRAVFREGFGWAQLARVAAAAVGVQFWVAGLAHVPIWQAISLLLLSPIFVTLGARLVLKEAVGPRRWAAVIVGAIGGAVILAPWSDRFTWAAFLPIAAAAFWAATSLWTKALSSRQSAESLTAWLLVLLVPVNALVGLGGGLAPPMDGAFVWIIAAGALVALAQYLLARAYGMADAGFLQPFDHMKLVFNIGLGIAVFGFFPPGSLWPGVALILGAALVLDR